MSTYAEQWPNSAFRPSEDRETALLRAWRVAYREYELNGRPHECEPEDQGWNLDIAAGAAEGNFSGFMTEAEIAERYRQAGEAALAVAEEEDWIAPG